MNLTPLEQEIISYYESCETDYKLVWHLNSHMAMHYGYWDKGVKRLRQALWQMNAQLAHHAEISSRDVVLDAGCGVGGSAIYLAQNIGCRVEGVTLSEKQVESARRKASELNLGHLVNFSRQNYTSINFPDNYFDVVWAIESVCHASEKADFLKESYRVLKPGGRLIIADFFTADAKTDFADRKLIAKWADSWAVSSFEDIEVFREKIAGTGYSSHHLHNITANIYPSARRLYYYFFPGLVCDTALRLIGKRTYIHNKNLWSTYYQYKSLKRNLWNYFIIKAVK
jgi:tocopherol O-methyltransferase